MKSFTCQQSQFIPLKGEHLQTPHVGRHEVDGRVEDALIQGGDVAFLNEQRAYFLQLQRANHLRVNARGFADLVV